MFKFVHFGCWNQGGCNKQGSNPLSNVMRTLRKYSSAHNPDLIIVAGDNYYPNKIKESGSKIKFINPDELASGFDCLPKQIPIQMILGNHDLETNKKNNLFINDESHAEKGNCFILQKELELSSGNNITFSLFNERFVNNTLILTIDTSMYDEDIKDMLSCYKYIDPRTGDTIESLREHQRGLIESAILKYKDNDIQNIIIVGHHPITGCKLKISDPNEAPKKKDKSKKVDAVTDESTASASESASASASEAVAVAVAVEPKPDKKKDKSKKAGIDENPSDSRIQYKHHMIKPFPEFIKLLTNTIFQGSTIKYYYLCADLHLYQTGIIDIPVEGPSPMHIEQYIVGTGGTELDEDPFIPVKNVDTVNILNRELYDKCMGNSTFTDNIYDILDYTMTTNDIRNSKKYKYGFLECIVGRNNDIPQFRFINKQNPSFHTKQISRRKSLSLGRSKSKSKTRKYRSV